MTNHRPSTTAAVGGMNAVPKIGGVPGPANSHLVQGVFGVMDDEVGEQDVQCKSSSSHMSFQRDRPLMSTDFQNNLESTPRTLAKDSNKRMEGCMPSFSLNRKDADNTGSASLITPPRPIDPNPFDLGSLSRSFHGVVGSSSSSEKRSNGLYTTNIWQQRTD